MIDGKATYAGTVLALQAKGKKIRTVESLPQRRQARSGGDVLRQARRHAVRLLHAGLRRGDAGVPRQAPAGARWKRFAPASAGTSAAAARTTASRSAAWSWRQRRRGVTLMAERTDRVETPPQRKQAIPRHPVRKLGIDGVEKATGRAKYSTDINPAGTLHARLLASPHALRQDHGDRRGTGKAGRRRPRRVRLPGREAGRPDSVRRAPDRRRGGRYAGPGRRTASRPSRSSTKCSTHFVNETDLAEALRARPRQAAEDRSGRGRRRGDRRCRRHGHRASTASTRSPTCAWSRTARTASGRPKAN